MTKVYLRVILAAIITTAIAPYSATAGEQVLFADNFDRAANNDLNVSTNGKSGLYASSNWYEAQNGTGSHGMMITNNQLRAYLFNEGDIWLNHNFVGLKKFTLTLDVVQQSSNGDGRFAGFGIGCALNSGSSDIRVGMDNVGATKGVYISANGIPGFHIGTVSPPDTFSLTCRYKDMLAGSAIHFEVSQNGGLIYTNSTTWSGEEENYITITSNSTNTDIFDNFSVEGIIRPPSGTLITLY